METLNIHDNIKHLVVKALNKYDTNIAAHKLGISVRTLMRYKSNFNIIKLYGKVHVVENIKK